jgi:carbon storage regulator
VQGRVHVRIIVRLDSLRGNAHAGTHAQVGESVVIGHKVTVTDLGVDRNQIRLGVTAPKDVPVHREEVFERIKRETIKAKA